MDQSIYDAIGGSAAVNVAVDRFYEKVWGDPDLLPYFEGIDRGKLKGHQRAFLATALGGPDVYRGRPLNQAHRGFGITDHSFDRVVEHLAVTLDELEVPAETIAQIAATVEPLRAALVERQSRFRTSDGERVEAAEDAPSARGAGSGQ